MKRLLTIIAIIAGCRAAFLPTAADGQTAVTEPRERIHIQTDKDNYLSGELVWMKLLTTTPDGAPLAFSKVGYVELSGSDGSVVKERLNLRDGTGNGTIVIPATLPTGYYRLAGYTRWMRNEGPEVFFSKTIGVVNPVAAEVPRDNDSATAVASVLPGATDAAWSAGNLVVSPSGGGVYAPRSRVELDISGIPDDLLTLSISVTGRDATGAFTRPSPDTRPAAAQALPAFSGRYIAEYEGPLVTGKLIDTATDTPVAVPGVHPLLSYPGDEINLFSGRVDEAGAVTFRTSRTAGFGEAVTAMLNPTGNGTGSRYRIDLDDPYTTRNIARPVPTFPLEAIDRESLSRQSLSMQIRYAYVNDSLNRGRRPAPLFDRDPDYRYIMEEWRRFATMPEVVTEFLKMLRFVRENGKPQLSVFNVDFPTMRTRPIVLLDGVPIIDHDVIYNYNPLLIKRIDVYYDRYLFGDDIFYGIVAFYTAAGNYPELPPDPGTRIVTYDSPSAERIFYAPDYSAAVSPNRLPDYRNTLYWDPEVAAEYGRAPVSFYTSDLTGGYQVLVEGVTKTGEPLRAVCTIEVR